jgi:hypothetical protein
MSNACQHNVLLTEILTTLSELGWALRMDFAFFQLIVTGFATYPISLKPLSPSPS